MSIIKSPKPYKSQLVERCLVILCAFNIFPMSYMIPVITENQKCWTTYFKIMLWLQTSLTFISSNCMTNDKCNVVHSEFNSMKYENHSNILGRLCLWCLSTQISKCCQISFNSRLCWTSPSRTHFINIGKLLSHLGWVITSNVKCGMNVVIHSRGKG